jgi:Na+-translocating ferredoxin:NAD+ oxidoreductase RnfG subunit
LKACTRSGRALLVAAALLLCAELRVTAASAQEMLSQQEALRLAFPGAVVERRTAYLDETQLRQAERLAGSGVAVKQRVVTYYVGSRNGRPQGTAYFDAHRVRTAGEVLMIVVDTAARVRRVEVLRFSEPPEYRASDRWLGQLLGKPLTPELSLRRDIVNMTGATLTARAVTAATRRTLALHAVINSSGTPR